MQAYSEWLETYAAWLSCRKIKFYICYKNRTNLLLIILGSSIMACSKEKTRAKERKAIMLCYSCQKRNRTIPPQVLLCTYWVWSSGTIVPSLIFSISVVKRVWAPLESQPWYWNYFKISVYMVIYSRYQCLKLIMWYSNNKAEQSRRLGW